MSSDHFYLFTALVSFSSHLQQRLQNVRSPQEIVAIAAENGYRISVAQLSLFAHRLNGDHWIWAGKDVEWRNRFFAEAGGLESASLSSAT